MADPLLDLYQTRPTYWQQNQAMSPQPGVVTGTSTSSQVGGQTTTDPMLSIDPYADYTDGNSRIKLNINYAPPEWKPEETVHNYGSKVDSKRVFQEGSRFNIALQDAGFTPEQWLRMPYEVKRDVLRNYAAQDFSNLKPELQAAEKDPERYFEKIAKAYGVGKDQGMDYGVFKGGADLLTEVGAGAARGLGGLVSFADENGTRAGVNVDIGAQKFLGKASEALQDAVKNEALESKRGYIQHLYDNGDYGQVVQEMITDPYLTATIIGPEAASMIASTLGIGTVAGIVGKGAALTGELVSKLGPNAAKLVNFVSANKDKLVKMADGFTGETAAGKVAAIAGNLALKGAGYRTAAAIQEAGGFRLDQYLKGRDVTSEDAQHAFEVAFLEQYIAQGLIPGTADSIIYKLLKGSGKYEGVGSKTLNELKDAVTKMDEGSILQRLNHKVDQIGGLGAVKRLVGTGAKEFTDEFAAGTTQSLLDQNLGRIQDPLIRASLPEDQRPNAGSLSLSTLADGDVNKAIGEGIQGGIVGLFLGGAAHPFGDAGHSVRMYKDAKARVADIDNRLADLDTVGYAEAGTAANGVAPMSKTDFNQRVSEIEQEFANGDRTNEQEYKDLIAEQQGRVSSLIDTIAQGDITVDQANRALGAINTNISRVNMMMDTLGKQQNIQQGVDPASLQGQYNKFASEFDTARKAANFTEDDEFTQGIADDIRALKDPANIQALEQRLNQMKQSPMMSDAKYASMVGTIEGAVNFARDPAAYYQDMPAEQPDAKQKISTFVKDTRAALKAFEGEELLPPSFTDALNKKGVTLDELQTATRETVTQLLELSKQAKDEGALDRAGRYTEVANRLLTQQFALHNLEQYKQARTVDYEAAQQNRMKSERDAAAEQIAQREQAQQDELEAAARQKTADFERPIVGNVKKQVLDVLNRSSSGFIADPNAKGVSNGLGETLDEVRANLADLIATTKAQATHTRDLLTNQALVHRARDLQQVLDTLEGKGGLQNEPDTFSNESLQILYPDTNEASTVVNTTEVIAKALGSKVRLRGRNTAFKEGINSLISSLENGGLNNGAIVPDNIDLNQVRDETIAYLNDVKAGRGGKLTADQYPAMFQYFGNDLISAAKSTHQAEVAKNVVEEHREARAKASNTKETAEQAAQNDAEFSELLQSVQDNKARTADDELLGGKKEKKSEDANSVSQLNRALSNPANAEFTRTSLELGGIKAYNKANAEGRTDLRYDQWVQVRTPSFKQRYGDWERGASKLVLNERTGEPKVFYHGTAAGSNIHDVFTGFRNNPDGTFVTPHKHIAEVYIRMSKRNLVGGGVKRDSSGSGFIHEVFLERGNPLVWDVQGEHAGTMHQQPLYFVEKGNAQEGSLSKLVTWLKSGDWGTKQYTPYFTQEEAERANPGKQVYKIDNELDTRTVAEAAYNAGYDGVVFENIRLREPGGVVDETTTYYTAKDPSQLVSANQHQGVYGDERTNIFGGKPSSDINTHLFKWGVQNEGVAAALVYAKNTFAQDDPRRQVIEKLVDLVDDKVNVRYDDLSSQGRTGYYDIATNTIVLDINSREADIDLMHELVHAYTVYAIENQGALTTEQAEIVDELRRAWTMARNNAEFVAQFPTINDDATGIHEFVAELLTNPKFQDAYDTMYRSQASKGIIASVREFFKRIAQLLGMSGNEQPHLFQLITNTTSIFAPNDSRVQTVQGVKEMDRKIVRQVIFANRTKEQNRNDDVSAIAQLDEDTGKWTMDWWDKQGNLTSVEGFTYENIEKHAQKLGLVPKHRSEYAQDEKYLAEVTDVAYNHSGLLYQLFKGIQRVLPTSLAEPIVRTLDRSVRWGANNLNNQYSWITTLENLARNVYGAEIPSEVETRINTIRQRASAELEHFGVGNKLNLRDHMDMMVQMAQRSGMTKEELDDLAYALRAPHFIRRKKRASGDKDPYYKGRDLLVDTISGFGYYELNGKRVAKETKGAKWVPDDTGEKFMNTLTPQQRAFAQEFEKAIIDMNNNTLDFELAMGRIDQNTYNDLYGEFYVPLQNEDSEVKAYAGRIHGRSTKAGNILSKYVANSQARINNAAESAVMREAADLLAKYPMPHMARIMSDELKTRGDKFHATYAPEGVLDGRSKAFYRDGKRERIVVTDPVFAKSLTKLSKAQKDNVTNTFIRTMGTTTRWLALTRTVLSPTFHVTAFLRDAVQVLANTQAASRGKLSDAQALQLSSRIIPRMVRVLPSLLKGEWNGKNAHWAYKTYLNEGGINPMAHYDLDKITGDLDMLAFNRSSMGSRAARGAKTFMQLMHFSDNAARYAAWLEYLQMMNGGREFTSERDLSEFLRAHPSYAEVARDISKNITGNFEQKGASNAPRAFFMFWNAAMGGVKTVYNLVNPKYGTYGLKMMGLLMLAVAAQGAADDEEDEDGTPMWKRTNESVSQFHIGGFKFNIPQELMIPLNMAREFVRVAKGQQEVGAATGRVLRSVQESILPFQTPETEDTAFNLAYGISPAMVQPLVSILANKDYFGRDLAPKNGWAQDGSFVSDPMDHQRRNMGDSNFAQWLTFEMAKLGVADVAPSSIDTWLSHFTGGAGKFIGDLAKASRFEGKDPVTAFSDMLVKKYSLNYNEYAVRDEFNKEYTRLMQKMSIGESSDELINLEASGARKELKDWAKKVSEEAKAVQSSQGYGTGDLFTMRKELELQLTPDVDELLNIKEQLNEIQIKQKFIYMRALEELKERAERYE